MEDEVNNAKKDVQAVQKELANISKAIGQLEVLFLNFLHKV